MSNKCLKEMEYYRNNIINKSSTPFFSRILKHVNTDQPRFAWLAGSFFTPSNGYQCRVCLQHNGAIDMITQVNIIQSIITIAHRYERDSISGITHLEAC